MSQICEGAISHVKYMYIIYVYVISSAVQGLQLTGPRSESSTWIEID